MSELTTRVTQLLVVVARLDVVATGDGKKQSSECRYDVALSFAGAQRPYVEQVARALSAQGIRCFYDADEQSELWGRYLAEELPRIYGDAGAVVIFVSAEPRFPG